MYYVKVIERKAVETGKSYKQIRVTDKDGNSRNFFPAFDFDVDKVSEEYQSEFPTKMTPVYVSFSFTSYEGKPDLKINGISLIEE